jgi:D-glycerate 3-kinase
LTHRGVPGTHQLDLGLSVLESLRKAGKYSVTKLPRFSKNTDNPWPKEKWPAFVGRPDVILVDSWFWNTRISTEEQLRTPINAREATEDEDGSWRKAVNEFLKERYLGFFREADFWIHLEAPSWDATVRWRVEQEMDLRAALPENERPSDDPTERLRHFLETFQRWGIQAHTQKPDVTVRLAEDHSIAIDT